MTTRYHRTMKIASGAVTGCTCGQKESFDQREQDCGPTLLVLVAAAKHKIGVADGRGDVTHDT